MSFTSLGLAAPLIQAVTDLGYTQATPIQTEAIPAILKGCDLLASAQTGTGKTAGFVLPVLQKAHQQGRVGSNQVRVLVLTPTRELAAQVHESIVQYGKHLSVRSAVVFGGVKINPQMMKLRSGVEILVATPGRLMDLHQQRAVNFDAIDTLILDEADRMLDMGFIHDIKRIIKLLPSKRQNLLFSATFSDSIRQLAKTLLHNPMEISVASRNTTATAVTQRLHPVDKGRKAALLSHLIHHYKWEQVLVFSRTKHGANKLVKQLNANHIYAAAIHGNKSQSQRTKILAEFKSGALHVLVATDIAARGLDIEELPCVINFDLPQVAEDYVHRIGRTARAGASGLALSLVSADEALQLHAIERLVKTKIKRVLVDDFEPDHDVPEASAVSSLRKKTPPPHNKFSRGPSRSTDKRRSRRSGASR